MDGALARDIEAREAEAATVMRVLEKEARRKKLIIFH